jgi:N-acetylneuraminate synthase
MVRSIVIDGREVGANRPCFFIAEAGVNHNGSLELAHQLVETAARAGADAVKFQTFKAERLATPEAAKAAYQRRETDPEESQYEMLRRLELSPAAHRELAEHCRRERIMFLSTPFDEESADLLNDLGVPAFKVPSGELTNLPFLSYVARFGKPLIVSTGMAGLGEVEAAVRAVRATGNEEIILLHCVSNYPADPVDVNLRAIETMTRAFGVPAGYSDHTEGTEVSLAAVALGACVVEKHFTLDRTLPGPDHRASLEPLELTALVRGIRVIESALGDGRKEPAAAEAETAAVARRSLVAARSLAAGTTLAEEMIAMKRPGTGLPPSMRSYLIGRVLRAPVREGELLSLQMFE